MGAIELVVLALAVARVTILITRDGIFEPVRHYIFLLSPPENDDRRGLYYQNFHPRLTRNGIDAGWSANDERQPGAIGEIVSCPDCCGIWVGLLAAIAYAGRPQETIAVATVFALAMAASLIARKGWYS